MRCAIMKKSYIFLNFISSILHGCLQYISIAISKGYNIQSTVIIRPKHNLLPGLKTAHY